ncbi:MAG: hypothetical protein K0Q46_6622 [Rhodococcus erythropolis]|jgi:hypothetical protein|nr:hypothetical protein [Rhodococcus erythropolis]
MKRIGRTPCGHDEAAGTDNGVQRLHKVGARLAPLGKWPLEAAFLSVVPGASGTSHSKADSRVPNASLIGLE